MAEQIITRDIASWIPKSFDEATRSVRVIAVTENPIRMMNWSTGGFYYQIVMVDGVYLPPSSQIPLLDSHNRNSVTSVLGSARNFIINGDALECDVFFSSTPLGLEAALKVKEGHLTDFSVGFVPVDTYWVPEGKTYSIHGRSFEGPLQVIAKWDLHELSITPIGADRHAKVRVWDGSPMTPPVITENPPENESEPFIEESEMNDSMAYQESFSDNAAPQENSPKKILLYVSIVLLILYMLQGLIN